MFEELLSVIIHKSSSTTIGSQITLFVLISRLHFMICIILSQLIYGLTEHLEILYVLNTVEISDCVLTLNKSTWRFAKLKCTIQNYSVLNTIPINAQWKWGTTQTSSAFTPVILISLFCHCNWNVNLIFWLLGELQVETYCCQNVSIVVRFRILANSIHLIKIHVQITFLLFARWKKLCLPTQSTLLTSSFRLTHLWSHDEDWKILLTFSVIIGNVL